MNDDQLRDLWRKAGGDFHGPIVETGTMPEAKLLPFLRSLAVQMNEYIAQTNTIAEVKQALATGLVQMRDARRLIERLTDEAKEAERQREDMQSAIQGAKADINMWGIKASNLQNERDALAAKLVECAAMGRQAEERTIQAEARLAEMKLAQLKERHRPNEQVEDGI